MYLWPDEAVDWFTSSNGGTRWKDGPVDQRATWRLVFHLFCFVFFPPYVFHFVSLHSCSPKTIALFLDLCNLRAGSLLYSEFEKFF